MAKRENGSGTIYQRDNGTWVGVIREKNAAGETKPKYFSGKTEAEVKRKIREYIRSNNSEKSNELFESYIKAWLSLYKYPSLKKSSYDRLENTINHQIIPYIGTYRLSDVTSDTIQNLIKILTSKCYSYSTIKKAHDCLSEIFKHAVNKGDIGKNPMLIVNMPKENQFEKEERKYFTEIEMSLISEECTKVYKTGKRVYPYGPAFILILNTGIRMGELIALKKIDYDKDSKILKIRRNAKNIKKRDKDGNAIGGVEIGIDTTKTYSGTRDIPLNDTAMNAINSLIENSNGEWLVSTSSGGIVPPERFERSFYRLLKNVGIEKTGTHSLRHTFASVLFSKGTDIKTVSQLLGHASTKITLDTYIHLINKTDAEAVKKLDAM